MWMYNFTVRLHECSEEGDESQHDEPVCNTARGESIHLCVTKNFLDCPRKPLALILKASWIWLTTADDGVDLPGLHCDEDEGNGGDAICDSGEQESHAARLERGGPIREYSRERHEAWKILGEAGIKPPGLRLNEY